jgi:two-component system, cell cycle sensor histidine kinase and response regulator CckA
LRTFYNKIPNQAISLRYGLALTSCALAVALERIIGAFGQSPINPFLTAFGAVIVSGAWAGAGPGLLSTVVLTLWSAYDLTGYHIVASDVSIRCALFFIDGVLLSLGSSRMWRSIQEAEQSEAWHRQLVQTAAEGIWVHDESGLITYSNARMAEILGMRESELTGRNVDEFFLPADVSIERVRAGNLRRQKKEQFDRRLRKSDGSEVWVLACCNAVEGQTQAGKVAGVLEMMTDITERKRAEHALVRSEQRFRNLFEGVLEGVYQSTPDGRVLAANPMLLQMLGVKNEAELNDVHIARDLYMDAKIRARLLEQLERDGGFQNVEYELRRRDGQVITVLENARVVRDENGVVLYYEGTLTDISRSKRMEEQLRQAQKVEALGRLAGGVAQDFNNVLTLITGFAQLGLSELPESHAARGNMQQVLLASESALGLTRQLLSFSRRHIPVEAGIDLNDAVERSEAVGQAEIRTSRRDGELFVHASQTQIDMIIRELASRTSSMARRRTSSVKLGLNTTVANLNADFCGVDSGIHPGAYAVLSMHAFHGNPEINEDSASGPRVAMQPGEAAAIGLSVMQATVTHCGGFVVRHGEDGFSVYLPRAVGTGPSATGESAEPAGETILLVEDEPLVRELSREMLERQGYRVMLAGSAEEAEKLSAIAGSFDLLITNIRMPEVSGIELARRLRAQHPGLKVLYVSGYAEEDSADPDAWEIEKGGFLQKPFSADSLGRKIRHMLKQP